MTKTVTLGRFLRHAGTGFATLCFAGLLATGAGCLPSGSNDNGSGGSGGSSSSESSGGGSSGDSSSSSNNGGSSSSSSSSSSGGGGGSSSSSSSSSSKAGSSGGSSSSSSSSSSGGGGSSSSSSSSSSASGGGGSSSSTPPAGGSSGSTPSGTTVTFTKGGKAAGAMTGYGWVALGSKDTVTDPTCGADKTAITSTTACASSTNWSSDTALCMTGSIPALDATTPDYTGNWGIQLGINASDATGGTLGQSFSTITIATSGSPSSGLRAIIHKKGDPETTSYCAAMAGSALTLTSFTTTCYDTAKPGTALTAADVTSIDKIGVQVSSSSTAVAVANFCITGITFGK